MSFYIRMHVADQHDQLLMLRVRKETLAIPFAALKPFRVDSIVNHAQLLGSESVFSDQRVTNRSGVGQHDIGKILNSPQPYPLRALVPLEVRQIASARNDRRYSRQPRRWNAHQVRPQVVRMNDVKSFAP